MINYYLAKLQNNTLVYNALLDDDENIDKASPQMPTKFRERIDMKFRDGRSIFVVDDCLWQPRVDGESAWEFQLITHSGKKGKGRAKSFNQNAQELLDDMLDDQQDTEWLPK